MAYETPITIKKAIENIKKRHYVLPSIQREFVWGTEQIETLFDSIMRNYPISTFLFWKVDKNKIKDFQFYEFLKKYHEKDHRHNIKADLEDDADIIVLLDGQQRMTSLYIALTGTYADKKRYASSKHANQYPERKLYLNLLKPSEDQEVEYDFRFLTKEDASLKNDSFFWFECSKIISFKEKNDTYDYLDENNLSDTSIYKKEVVQFARNTINRFYDAIHKDGTISFYLEEGEELDKVLQIFIRINSGGTKLSYSDLLLSIATAQWNEKDAREIIHEFVDDINKIGDGFNFNKDIVLKNCLVLGDIGDVKFKVDNFSNENMKNIERDWDKTSSALRSAIELVSKFGYNSKNLIATNAVIPIAYFIFKNRCDDQILHSQKWENDRKAIKEWLARVFLKGVFSGQIDTIFPPMRKLINDNMGRFPLAEIINYYKGKSKSISFSEDEIDNLLELQYGTAKTYCALTLIYQGLNHNFKYHQDHVHPKNRLNKQSMKAAGLSKDMIAQFNSGVNSIANLQLLEATGNFEKNDKLFNEWLNLTYSNKIDRDRYLTQHYINPEQSLEIEDFMDFLAARRREIKSKLISVLGMGLEELAQSA